MQRFLSVCIAICAVLGLRLSTHLCQAAEPSASKEIYNSQAVDVPRMDPEAVVKTVKLPDGFRLQVAAAAPEIQQPIAMAWDRRGRLWVIECYSYAERNLKYDVELKDRVLIFEDTDGDGTLESRKVFWDQGRKLSGIEIGLGGVWLTSLPNLIFIADKDGDDKPDSEPEIILDGFDEDAIHHNMANGLRWGPDGWLYGRQGIQGTSSVGPPGSSGLDRKTFSCAIWRYHPIAKKVDIVSQGTTNSWGMDWDANGHLFFINTVIGHLWHSIPGAHMQRMYGEDSDPFVFELMQQVADHWHFDRGNEEWSAIRSGAASSGTEKLGGGHAHSGMLIYQGNNLPKDYLGKFFTINFHGRRLNIERMDRSGAGFIGRHEPDIMFIQDPWFRGVELSQAPDGSIYIIDWSDTGECHENDGVHRSSGTIYRLSHLEKSKPLVAVEKLNTAELTRACLSEDVWLQRQARQRIVELDDVSAMEEIKGTLEKLSRSDTEPRRRLNAFFTLDSADQINPKDLDVYLRDRDEHVRIAAIAFATDPRRVGPESIDLIAKNLPEIAHADNSKLATRGGQADQKSDLVLLYLTGALQKISFAKAHADSWTKTFDVLFDQTHLAADRDYPLMLWYAAKDKLDAEVIDLTSGYKRTSAVSTAKDSSDVNNPFGKIVRFAVRKAATQIDQSSELLDSYIALASKQPAMDEDLVYGMYEGLQGRNKIQAPKTWSSYVETVKHRSSEEELLLDVERLNGIFGNSVSIDELIATAKDGKASVAARRNALRTLVEEGNDNVMAIAKPLLYDRLFSEVAVLAILRVGTTKDVDDLVGVYGNPGALPAAGKSAFVSGMSSKRELMGRLLDSVESKVIPRDAVGADLRRQMQLIDDPAITAKLKSIWPDTGLMAEEKIKQIMAFESLIKSDSTSPGNPHNGREHWNKICASCHKMFGEGAAIGPELTGAQRSNLRYLSENIIDPSLTVADNYRVTLIVQDNDQILSGVIVQENASTITLQTTKEKVVIEKSSIEERKPSKQSLMPDGLLDNLDGQAKRDLVAYLQSTRQVD